MDRTHAQTIQIFLPDGNPRSVRMAEITSRTTRAIEIPRSKLEVASKRKEVCQVGLYFLFGEDEDAAQPPVYIGESENCLTRVIQHHQAKDFWTRAVVVTSKTNHFDKAKVKWLEWHALSETARIGRFKAENSTQPGETYVSEPVQADLLDTFGTVRTLLSTLGFPLFEEVRAHGTERDLYVCEGRGAYGQCEVIDDGGFLVLKGSKAARTLTNSSKGKYADRVRERLLASGVLLDDGKHYVFVQDHLFSAPSAAAQAVLGRSSNGWTAWKDSNGTTLDEKIRQLATAPK